MTPAHLAAAYAGLNLLLSNVLVPLLPEGGLRFAVGMWLPALTAVVFLVAAKAPVWTGLNLQRGQARAYWRAIGIAVGVAVGTSILGLLTGHLQWQRGFTLTVGSAIPTFVVWCLASLGEEIGWRGYLHNQLQGWAHAPLAIGLTWGAWHYADLIAGHAEAQTIIVFTTMTVLISYVLSWLVATGGSVWACTVFHGTWNFLRQKVLFGDPAHGRPGLFVTDAPPLTEMEGVLGLLVTAMLASVIIWHWYRRVVPSLLEVRPAETSP